MKKLECSKQAIFKTPLLLIWFLVFQKERRGATMDTLAWDNGIGPRRRSVGVWARGVAICLLLLGGRVMINRDGRGH